MKNLYLLLLLLIPTTLLAIPAKRGVKKTITLSDGTKVEATLHGDEFSSYWETADGNSFVALDGGKYKKVNTNTLLKKAAKLRNAANSVRAKRLQRGPAYAPIDGTKRSYLGRKKGLIILVNFADVSFKTFHRASYYNRVANERGFTYNGVYKGSLKDYFLAQSNNKFELDFDVVGPYTLSHNMAYYGAHSNDGESDVRAGNMVYEVLQLAENDVNYANYDWDGDGEVEQVYVLYAGYGEADGGGENTIWPHEHQLSASSVGRRYYSVHGNDTITLNTYACGNELKANGQPSGIGTICHEFSHCLGYPDTYDTGNSNYGMGSWDLMDQGSYNGNGYCPPNYTAYEKWIAGWITPTVLDKATTVKGMKAQDADYGQAFIIYNDAHPDEYYLLENRQNNIGLWDTAIPGSGLMITHLDYNKDIWEMNNVNTIINYSKTFGEQYAYLDNDHQRMTIFHADNTDTFQNEDTDLYPYNGNDSLTDTSLPAAIIYNNGSFMGKPITKITQNADGSIDFDFMGGSSTNIFDGIESIRVSNSSSKDNIMYNLAGQRVSDNYHGIVIQNGKKFIKK